VQFVGYVLGLVTTFVGTGLTGLGIACILSNLFNSDPKAAGIAGGMAPVLLTVGVFFLLCGISLARATRPRA
jgi:hypothetical protein